MAITLAKMLEPHGSWNELALKVDIFTEHVALERIVESEPSQSVKSIANVTPSKVLIEIEYAKIGEPFALGADHVISTLSLFTLVVGADGVAGTSAAKTKT